MILNSPRLQSYAPSICRICRFFCVCKKIICMRWRLWAVVNVLFFFFEKISSIKRLFSNFQIRKSETLNLFRCRKQHWIRFVMVSHVKGGLWPLGEVFFRSATWSFPRTTTQQLKSLSYQEPNPLSVDPRSVFNRSATWFDNLWLINLHFFHLFAGKETANCCRYTQSACWFYYVGGVPRSEMHDNMSYANREYSEKPLTLLQYSSSLCSNSISPLSARKKNL